MTPATGPAVVAALLTAFAAGAAAALVVRPTPRLASRVRPYTAAARARLGLPPAGAADDGPLLSSGVLARVFGPMVVRLAHGLGAVVDSAGDETLRLRLRQAGLLVHVPEERRAQEYRMRQLGVTAGWTGTAAVVMAAAGASAGAVLLVTALACVHGATRWRARVDRAIEARRLRMRIELYTVNQLLALQVRAGGGVVQAISRVVERGRGPVVAELAEVLRAHRAGRPLPQALSAAAAASAEPNAARTYRLLAGGAEYGADLAGALRRLADDVRSQRVEAIKRTATRRRAAMLVPIIALLAPIMLLFVAAPLPSLVLGGR